MDNLIELIESLRVQHYHVEDDCWYSCAADPECCDRDRKRQTGGRCDCGADEHNRRVDEALAELRKVLAGIEAAEVVNPDGTVLVGAGEDVSRDVLEQVLADLGDDDWTIIDNSIYLATDIEAL